MFNRHGVEKDERTIAIERSEIESVQEDKQVEEEILERSIKLRLNEILNKEEILKPYKDFKAGSTLDKDLLEKLNIKEYWKIELKNKDTSNKVLQLKRTI